MASVAESMSVSSEQSLAVKRSAVTYGRRREPPSDADTSTSTVFTLSSRGSLHALSPSALDENIPPSSDEGDALQSSIMQTDDLASDDDHDDSGGSPFVFSWRKGLEDVDNYYAQKESFFDNKAASSAGQEEGRTSASPQQLRLPSIGHEEPSNRDHNRGQLPSLIDFSQSIDRAASRSPSPAIRRRRIKVAKTVHDSDNESNTSPVRLHHHATLSTLSSPAPVSPKISPARDKGKGKQRSAELLDSDNEQPEGDGDADQRKGRCKQSGRKKKVDRTKVGTD